MGCDILPPSIFFIFSYVNKRSVLVINVALKLVNDFKIKENQLDPVGKCLGTSLRGIKVFGGKKKLRNPIGF